MADDGVTDGDVVHRGADLVHPAGVLVAERQRQIGGPRWGEPPVADVHVGAAQPCPGDPHDHVVRTGDRGLGDLVQSRRLMVGVQAYGLHGVTSLPFGLVPVCAGQLGRAGGLHLHKGSGFLTRFDVAGDQQSRKSARLEP